MQEKSILTFLDSRPAFTGNNCLDFTIEAEDNAVPNVVVMVVENKSFMAHPEVTPHEKINQTP